jgi:NAD-dependent deacetylase
MKNNLIVLSGAGISADSGLQTFRAAGTGLWQNHDLNIVCDYLTWQENIDVVHRFYNDRRRDVAKANPNLAHQLVATWESRYRDRLINLTTNVDDLLERSGCANVVHLHGILTKMKCIACGHEWELGFQDWNPTKDRCSRCNSCRSVKPGVTFFNELVPLYRTLFKTFMSTKPDDVIVVIGSSGAVININSLVFDRPGFKILNNLEPTILINESYFDQVHYRRAAEATSHLDEFVSILMGSEEKI